METYKYSININQNAAIKLGLDVDIIDLAIFDYIKDFANSKKCETIVTENGVYFWVSHKNIIDNMPLLNITTTRGIAKRVDKLINAGLLIKYSRCDQVSRTYYTFGEKYDEYLFVRTPEQKFEGGRINIQGNINIIENKESTHFVRTEEKTDTSNFDLTFIRPDYANCVLEWLTHKKKIKKGYKTEAGIRKMYNALFQMSHGDSSVAQMIIDQSIANNWDGLFPLKTVTATMSKTQQQEQESYEKQKRVLEMMAERERRQQDGNYGVASTITDTL
jgi:hypothetical protein